MKFLKKKIVIAAVIVIVVATIGFLVIRLFGFSDGSSEARRPGFEDIQAKEVDPSEIGLELSLRSDGKAVIITATKIDGIESLEYELTYDAEVTEGGRTVVVPRGAVGILKISGDQASAEVDLGTCSSGVCKYDNVVSDVAVLIKINYENGEVGVAEDTVALEE